MQDTKAVHTSRDDTESRDAARFAIQLSALGVMFFVMAGAWLSTCGADVDSAACSAPQRIGLALGAPLILLVSGVWAFVRTYHVWRDGGRFFAWQAAGWFLMCLMLVALTMGVPPMAGPVLGS